MTPAAKLPPVSTTPAANFSTSFASVVDVSTIPEAMGAIIKLLTT